MPATTQPIIIVERKPTEVRVYYADFLGRPIDGNFASIPLSLAAAVADALDAGHRGIRRVCNASELITVAFDGDGAAVSSACDGIAFDAIDAGAVAAALHEMAVGNYSDGAFLPVVLGEDGVRPIGGRACVGGDAWPYSQGTNPRGTSLAGRFLELLD